MHYDVIFIQPSIFCVLVEVICSVLITIVLLKTKTKVKSPLVAHD